MAYNVIKLLLIRAISSRQVDCRFLYKKLPLLPSFQWYSLNNVTDYNTNENICQLQYYCSVTSPAGRLATMNLQLALPVAFTIYLVKLLHIHLFMFVHPPTPMVPKLLTLQSPFLPEHIPNVSRTFFFFLLSWFYVPSSSPSPQWSHRSFYCQLLELMICRTIFLSIF